MSNNREKGLRFYLSREKLEELGVENLNLEVVKNWLQAGKNDLEILSVIEKSNAEIVSEVLAGIEVSNAKNLARCEESNAILKEIDTKISAGIEELNAKIRAVVEIFFPVAEAVLLGTAEGARKMKTRQFNPNSRGFSEEDERNVLADVNQRVQILRAVAGKFFPGLATSLLLRMPKRGTKS